MQQPAAKKHDPTRADNAAKPENGELDGSDRPLESGGLA